MEKSNRNALKIGFQYGLAFLLGRFLFDLAFAVATAENILAQIVGGWNGRLWGTFLFSLLASFLISELGERFYSTQLLWRWWCIGLVHGLWLGSFALIPSTNIDLINIYVFITICLLILPLFLFPGDSKIFVRPTSRWLFRKNKTAKSSSEKYVINGGLLTFKESGNVLVEKFSVWRIVTFFIGLIVAVAILLLNWPPYESARLSLWDFQTVENGVIDPEKIGELIFGAILFVEMLIAFLLSVLYLGQRARLPLTIGHEPEIYPSRIPYIAWQDVLQVEVTANNETRWRLWPTAEIKLHLRDGRLHTLAQISPLVTLQPQKLAQKLADNLRASFLIANTPPSDDLLQK